MWKPTTPICLENASDPVPPSIAYLVNIYPGFSHSFIRTEILALERQGVSVRRFAIRGWREVPQDEVDAAEQAKTRYVLAGGLASIALAAIGTALTRPLRFCRALAAGWRLSRSPAQGLPLYLVYLAEACLLARWLRQEGIEHVHAHFGTNATTVALLAGIIGGTSFSFTVHGPEEFDKPYQLRMPEKIAAAAFVVAITSFCRSQLYRYAALRNWPKIRIVHCAIDPRFAGAEDSGPLSPDTIVCVGRLCEQKGQVILLRAVAELKRRGKPVRLILIGDGDMRGEIEGEIAQLGLGGEVELTGALGPDQVLAHLRQGRAFVLPSFAEGLPVAIMEAMALHRPVVSTRIAGISELVREGSDGLLVPPSDTAALADAIEQVLTADDEVIRERGKAAAARVRERHSADIEAAKLASLFREVSASTR